MSKPSADGAGSSAAYRWPALSLGDAVLPAVLDCERAIWGKAHGVATDYRWLARSSGFAIADRPELELNVGLEDRPTRAFFWRVTRRAWAVVGYRSRAVDAAGRSGFFEKQVLEWRGAGVSRALGALLLLDSVGSLNDSVWWGRNDDDRWADAGFTLELGADEVPRIPCDGPSLARRIAGACSALRESVSEAALAAFYTQLLGGDRPAILQRDEPLSAGALAALLLPLPRRLADSLSLAGWVPSSRGVNLGELAERWQGLVTTREAAAAAGEPSELGRSLARAVLAGTPEDLPELPADDGRPALDGEAASVAVSGETVSGETVSTERDPERSEPPAFAAGWPSDELSLTPPAKDCTPLLRHLYRFAASSRRRWLEPRDLAGQLGGLLDPLTDAGERRLLLGWVEEVEAQRPKGASAKQWGSKVDLLRSAALALVPESQTLADVGLPTTGRVPALAFAAFLRPEALKALGRAYGKEGWSSFLQHSLEGCPKVEQWSAELRLLLKERLGRKTG